VGSLLFFTIKKRNVSSVHVVGFDAHLSYNIALCYYRLRDFAPALKHIADIIERGIRDHPELSVGMQTEGIEVIRTSHILNFFKELA
jgi:tetratricopeptide repeat protein 30